MRMTLKMIRQHTLDVKKRHIESSSAQIKDENVSLLTGLSCTQTISNGSSSGLVDDTENVQSGDGTSIFSGLTLVVIEVCRYGNDSLLNSLGQLGLSNLLHL